jgi:hypothetical protein
MSPEKRKLIRAFLKMIYEWHADSGEKTSSLLQANYTDVLARLSSKERNAAAKDALTLLQELFGKRGGDAAQLGVMKLASLVRARGGSFSGRVHRCCSAKCPRGCDSSQSSLLAKWKQIAETQDADLRALATTAVETAPATASTKKKQRKRKKKNDKDDDEGGSSDSSGSDGEDGNAAKAHRSTPQ